MKKTGLIGEDPNDTLSIGNLLAGKYPGSFQFKQLIKNKGVPAKQCTYRCSA